MLKTKVRNFQIRFFHITNHFAMSNTTLDRENVRLFFEVLCESMPYIVPEVLADY